MSKIDKNYLQKLFINEAKPALSRHSGGGGGSEASDKSLEEFLKLRDGKNLFYGCSTMTDAELISLMSYVSPNTKNFTTADSMFYGCRLITSIPSIDTSNIVNMHYMFNGCYKLTSIPSMNTSNVTDMLSMFYNCWDLISIPPMDTRKVASSDGMFYGCADLVSVPELDLREATSTSSMFLNCHLLTNVRLKNLKVNIQIASGTSYGHLIEVEDLIFMIYHLRDTGSSKTFTIGNANLEKLANIYVKTIEITDAMRAEDDLIDEKLPFEVCESTDEGATLIEEYALLKNWTLK